MTEPGTDGGALLLHGADYSVYTRIARLALIAKGVAHRLVQTDVFDDPEAREAQRGRHPFGRIPSLDHDGFRLYETTAMTRYVDEAFDGPALQPGEPRARARQNQMVALLDAYGYRPMVWGLYVAERKARERGLVPDLAAAVAESRQCLAALAALAAPPVEGPWLLGAAPCLADFHAAPMIAYLLEAGPGPVLIAEQPRLAAWWETVQRHPAMVATPYPSEAP